MSTYAWLTVAFVINAMALMAAARNQAEILTVIFGGINAALLAALIYQAVQS